MNDMHDDLVATIDRICEAHCTRATWEAAERGEWPAVLWQAFEDVGLVRAALPEDAGGPGLDFESAMLALRRVAYHAAPVPLAETMMAGRLLVAAGLPVPDGPLSIAPTNAIDSLVMSDAPDGMIVSGRAARVPWGDACPHVVVVATNKHDGGSWVALASREGMRTSGGRNLAGEPRVACEFDGAPVLATARLETAIARLELEGALARSVQMTGALERVLAYTLQYANERAQFGRPIGKFQAVQHMLAIMAGHVAASSALADAAVETAAEAPREFAVAVAKARVGEAAGKCTEIAHQVHGAMGYTHEHNLHHTTRRLWAWREEFGNEAAWQVRLGNAVAAKGGERLWSDLTALQRTVA